MRLSLPAVVSSNRIEQVNVEVNSFVSYIAFRQTCKRAFQKEDEEKGDLKAVIVGYFHVKSDTAELCNEFRDVR